MADRILLATTPKGEKHLQQMVKVGYINLPVTQRVEWDILHDLTLQGDTVSMRVFLAEGRDTILGRQFAHLSDRGEKGHLLIESYGKILHRLITEGYIKAWRE